MCMRRMFLNAIHRCQNPIESMEIEYYHCFPSGDLMFACSLGPVKPGLELHGIYQFLIYADNLNLLFKNLI
jgi:hypothetical protein